MNSIQLQHYFNRIKIEFPAEINLQTLALIQEQHARSIPFENLNPLLDLPVLLDIDTLYNKMLIEKRGGYCYEQNVLFLAVLKALGYKARGLMGRVNEKQKGFLRRTHMLVLIEIDERFYISDVGFGSDAACVPLLLEADIEQKTPAGNYRFLTDEKCGYILQDDFNGKWRSLYCFDLVEQQHEDFEVGNWYTSTHPSVHFRTDLLVSIKADDRRYTLVNNILYTYIPGSETEKRVLISLNEMRNILTDVFGINLIGLPGLDIKLKELLMWPAND